MNKKLQQPDQCRRYKGYSVTLMNINWTTHLDRAWQANVRLTSWRTKVAYGSSVDVAFENMKVVIDSLK